jgi:hypothetical protein
MSEENMLKTPMVRQPRSYSKQLQELPRPASYILVSMLGISALANSDLFSAVAPLHYLVYGIPPLLMTFWFIYENSRWGKAAINQPAVGILLGLLVIPTLNGGLESARYVVFMWLGFLCYAFPIKIPGRSIDRLFMFLSAAQLVLTIRSGVNSERFGVDSFQGGSAAVTHTLPVLFGIFLPRYLTSRKPKYIALNIVMIVLAGKRGVLLASLLASLATILAERVVGILSSARTRPRFIAFSSLIVFAGFLISLKLPTIFEEISAYADLNINTFTSGRYLGQLYAYEALANADVYEKLFGYGLGTADRLAVEGFNGDTTLIHSDYLRMMVDMGYVLGAAYALFYMNLVGRGKLGVYFIVFSSYLWFTENNLINVMVTVAFYLTSAAGPVSRAPQIGRLMRARPVSRMPRVANGSPDGHA